MHVIKFGVKDFMVAHQRVCMGEYIKVGGFMDNGASKSLQYLHEKKNVAI